MENCQKIKLLKLMELLRQETDEFHAITTSEICRRLGEMGISCERRTVGKDITVLRHQGYEIMSELHGHENSYWIADRTFSVPELKILMDAVQAAHFISEDKTAEFVSKIAALAGSHQAKLLTGNLVQFNTVKHSNQSIFYNIEMIEEGLIQKKRVSFRYYDLDEKKNKKYRMEGGRYQTDPICLVFDDNNYYLLGYSTKYRRILTYRVDRMDRVEVEDKPVSAAAEKKTAKNTEKFRMYGGERQPVTLRFSDQILALIFDKFGENTVVTRVNENECEIIVNVQLSPPFWSWLFMLSGKISIIGPESVRSEYALKLKNAYEAIE